MINFTSSLSPLSGGRSGVRSGLTVPEGGWFHLQVNLKEQGQLRCQDEFIVCCGRKKYLRHVFLFEDLILFSKTKKVDGGYDTYMYKQSFKVTRLPLTGRRWVSGPGLLGVSRDMCYLLFSVILSGLRKPQTFKNCKEALVLYSSMYWFSGWKKSPQSVTPFQILACL